MKHLVRLQTCEKAVLFCAKTTMRVMTRGRRRRGKKKKEEHFGHLATFWFDTFMMLFLCNWEVCLS